MLNSKEQLNAAFSFSRFLAFLKLIIATSSRKLLIVAGVGFVISSIFLVWIVCDAGMTPPGESTALASVLYVLVFILGSVLFASASVVAAARGLQDYNRRESAWNIMLLPVSKTEKYIAHYIYSVIIVPIVFAAAFGASVGISIACLQYFGADTMEVFSNLRQILHFMRLFEAKAEISLVNAGIVLFILSCLSTQASFFAAASFAQKHPILAGVGISAAVNFVLQTLTSAITAGMDKMGLGDLMCVTENSCENIAKAGNAISTLFYTGIAVHLFVIAALAVGGYFLYIKRTAP